MSAFRDVVVTGLGVVSPIGIGLEPFWQALLAGRSGIKPLTRLNTTGLPVHFGGEVTDFEPKQFIRPLKSLKVMCRDIQLGVAAAGMALSQAKINAESVNPERFGAVFGADAIPCEPQEVAEAYRACLRDGKFSLAAWGERGLEAIHPLWMLRYLPNMPACHIAIAHDARGPNNTITLGEVSSLAAIAEAAQVIERGAADVMVCGGASTRLTPVNFVRGFVGQMSERNDAPEQASRPFERDRDGMVLSEGAAAIVLEHRRHAKARDAQPLAALVGYGAAHAARPSIADQMSRAIQAAMARALQGADWSAADVGHVNAHGMSTTLDDVAEARAIRAAIDGTPVTAPKGALGHMGAGSGAVELVAALLACARGVVPATLNYHAAAADCPIRVISGDACEVAKQTALVLSHAATGQATALAVTAER